MKNPILPRSFRCVHCGAHIPVDFPLMGVRNRNHCPYCLWSRHLDWQTPGDRLSSCKAAMRPRGLTIKTTFKKYGISPSGELMIIHECVDCRRISINRIASDDGTDNLVEVFLVSQEEKDGFKTDLDQQGIRLLDRADWEVVSIRLFGERLPMGTGKPIEPARSME